MPRILPRRAPFGALVSAFVVSVLHSAVMQGQKDTTKLGTVVVSATAAPVSQSGSPQPVTVISGAGLRARGITRVSDALRDVPGAMVVSNGPVGSVTSLFLRGGESRYTKVLIDNVPVNAAGGSFDFSHLTTDNIDRIEIVRGPASVIYGADAVAGVVRIFTRRGSGKQALDLGARAGNYGTRDADASILGALNGASYSFAAGRHMTDGIFPFNNSYDNGTLSTLASLNLGRRTSIALSGRYTDAEYHYPTDYTGALVDSNVFRSQHRFTAGISLTHRIAASVEGRLSAAANAVNDYTDDIGESFTGDIQHSRFYSRGTRRLIDAAVTSYFSWGGALTVGALYQREGESATNRAGPVDGTMTPTSEFSAARVGRAAYAELGGEAASRISYTLSARVDDDSDYDRFTSYRVAANAPIIPTVRLRASLSTAFNAPAFGQIHETQYTAPNPLLEPERARAVDVALEHTPLGGPLTLSAGYFHQRFADMIQYVFGGPPDYKGRYDNLAEAVARGYQAEAILAPVHGFQGSASFTWLTAMATGVDPLSGGGLVEGEALLRRPTHSGTVRIGYWTESRGAVDLTAHLVGKRPDMDFTQFPSPTVTLPAYTRFDLGGMLDLGKVARPFGSPLALTVRLENAFDRKYEDVLHFPAPGRTLLLGAKLSTPR
jgi:vitamin B12 transporter